MIVSGSVSDDDVTLNELRRDIRDMQRNYEMRMAEYREDHQRAFNDLQRTVDKVLDAMPQLPYVRQDVYEERQKTTGERIGKIENTLTKINTTAWTGVVLPLVVMIIGTVLVAAANIK